MFEVVLRREKVNTESKTPIVRDLGGKVLSLGPDVGQHIIVERELSVVGRDRASAMMMESRPGITQASVASSPYSVCIL